MKKANSLFNIILLFGMLVQFLQPHSVFAYQEISPETQAATLLNLMTPEERVGQLFLVEFTGQDVSEESELYQLIQRYQVGGVMLQRANENFSDSPTVMNDTWALTDALQRAVWAISQNTTTTITGVTYSPQFVPLFIGTEQVGNGPPLDEILTGLSPLPSQLALGATWNTDLAFEAGAVLGDELNALGINLLFGPSLDISESPNAARLGDLGTETFGGDPYWVGEFSKAYINGLHDGSDNKLMVIGKHFLGFTGADNALKDEVPTVRKSLEQLDQIELQPFYQVTGANENKDQRVDGLLLSHIRYQGFQGNIRTTTKPLSFDAQAFEQVLALPEIAVWREDSGLIISDDLGAGAVHRFYELSGTEYSPRLVARDAFLAGNDMLYLGKGFRGADADQTAAIISTINFFVQKYREDLSFSQRVDQSVLRILTHKYRRYENFGLENVLVAKSGLFRLGDVESIAFEVARQSATLISPSSEDLNSVLPTVPSLNDQILIIVDQYFVQQCTECAEIPIPQKQDFAEILNQLYGPTTDGLIQSQNLLTYTYSDLNVLLNGDPNGQSLLNQFNRVEWVIFLAQDVDVNRADANALQRLLTQRPELLQGKHSIVFSFHTPYNLGATEIAKVSAYYALYAKQPQFLEVAARLLFRELPTPGSSPVSIPGIGYDLIKATSPNINQKLNLVLDPNGSISGDDQSGQPINVGRGDTISLYTSVILDNNGHIVPDDTPVLFKVDLTLEGVTSQRQVTVSTRDGIANFVFNAERGVTQVQVSTGAEGTLISNSLFFDVAESTTGFPIVVTAPANGENSAGDFSTSIQSDQMEFGHWLLSVLISIFIAIFAYQALVGQQDFVWGARGAMASMIGGQVMNAYIAFGLPGTSLFTANNFVSGVVLLTLIGAIIGWVAAFVWRWMTLRAE